MVLGWPLFIPSAWTAFVFMDGVYRRRGVGWEYAGPA